TSSPPDDFTCLATAGMMMVTDTDDRRMMSSVEIRSARYGGPLHLGLTLRHARPGETVSESLRYGHFVQPVRERARVSLRAERQYSLQERWRDVRSWAVLVRQLLPWGYR